jgi:hypothetical protein
MLQRGVGVVATTQDYEEKKSEERRPLVLLSPRKGGGLVVVPCEKENFNYSVKSYLHVPSPLVLGAPPPSPAQRSTVILLLGASLLPPCSAVRGHPMLRAPPRSPPLGASPTAPDQATDRPNTTVSLRRCLLPWRSGHLITHAIDAPHWELQHRGPVRCFCHICDKRTILFIEAGRPTAFVKFLNN